MWLTGDGLRDLDFPWNSRRGAEETGRLILAAVCLMTCFTLLTCEWGGGGMSACDQILYVYLNSIRNESQDNTVAMSQQTHVHAHVVAQLQCTCTCVQTQ